MIYLPRFRWAAPQTLSDALNLAGNNTQFYSGGTELLPAMSAGLMAPDLLVSLNGVAELREISLSKGVMELGACATHQQVATSRTVMSHIPLLAEVCSRVGNCRVRSTGTLGGNIAFGDPQSDLMVALFALDASVRIANPHGSRVCSISDLVRGPYEIDLQETEVITQILVPCVTVLDAGFEKFSITERPIVSCVVVNLRPGYRCVVGGAIFPPTVIDLESLSEVHAPGLVDDLVFDSFDGIDADYKASLTQTLLQRCAAKVHRTRRSVAT